MSIEELKLALVALETLTKEMLALRDELAERGGRPKANVFHQRLWDSSHKAYVDTAIPTAEALRQAIEQAEQAQPVGEVLNERGEVDWISFVPAVGTSLYTAPPPRQPLSNEEIAMADREAHIAFCLNKHQTYAHALARAIEAANGIKGEA
jgi:hypothetical protein